MKKNLGDGDRALRIVIAGMLLIFFLLGVGKGVVGTIMLVLAGILALTAFAGVCPLYKLFGIDTCKIKKA